MKITLPVKEALSICIVLGFILLPSGVATPPASTPGLKPPITVDDDGDGDFVHIQDAIDNATAGTTIKVYSGEYHEIITCDKQLILQGIPTELGNGSDTGKPIVVMNDPDAEINLITLLADDCTIIGFHLKGEGNRITGIEVETCYSYISCCNFENAGIGIYFDAANTYVFSNMFIDSGIGISSDHNVIFDNNINNNGIGIGRYAHNNTLYKNTITNSYYPGIHLYRTCFNSIYQNTIRRCGGGILIQGYDSDSDSVWGNTISDCSIGIETHGKHHRIFQNNVTNGTDGISSSGETFVDYASQVNQNTVCNCENGISLNSAVNATNNKIHDCTTGLLLVNTYRCLIANNTIDNNTDGIILKDGSQLNTICNNVISQNSGTGIKFLNGYNNLLYHNAFLNNHRSAFIGNEDPVYPWMDHNHWNLGYTNTGGGNYWSDYRGKDRNHDGIGDTPYTIRDIFLNPLTNDHDHFPLMDPDAPLTCNTTLVRLYTIYDHIIRLLLRGYAEFYPGFP